MTTLALARLVLFWCGLTVAVAKLVAKAYAAGRRKALARARATLARRRKARALPWAEELVAAKV